jgi:hypothetical protein
MVKFFEAQDTGSGDRDFAPDYLKRFPKQDGTLHDVTEIKKVVSGKGYLLYTEHFLVWLWKKEKSAQQVIEALRVYIDTKEGFTLVCKLDKTKKSGCILGVDFERPTTWFAMGNDSYTLDEDAISQESTDSGNPFLPQEKTTAPTPLSAETDLSTVGMGGEGQDENAPKGPQKARKPLPPSSKVG